MILPDKQDSLHKAFNAIRRTLKSETILFLKEELMRIEHGTISS
jgi:hypothetical protein